MRHRLIEFGFLSTLSLRRATGSLAEVAKYATISIHALLAESDFFTNLKDAAAANFYPRSPCGERPDIIMLDEYQKEISIHALLAESDPVRDRKPVQRRDFYPRSPCGERHMGVYEQEHSYAISIHALLAESDLKRCLIRFSTFRFLSTLSLRRATLPAGILRRWQRIFLSTLSLRRATCRARSRRQPSSNFYPRSPCGERRAYRDLRCCRPQISIHALLAESDGSVHRTIDTASRFLSTLSLRRATQQRAERQHRSQYFYPRSPCGERRNVRICCLCRV